MSDASSSFTADKKKLDSVNHLLLRLQQQQNHSPEKDDKSGSPRVLSTIRATVAEQQGNGNGNGNGDGNIDGDGDTNESEPGIFVTADRDLAEGTGILSCFSEGFVMKGPEDRSNYCSYCCARRGKGFSVCPSCRDPFGNPFVGYCPDCEGLHRARHVERPLECLAVRCLVASLTEPRGNGEPALSPEEDATNQAIGAVFGSSAALLALRLVSMHRNGALPSPPNQGGGGGGPPACPPPRDDDLWEDLSLLHEHSLPLLEGPYESIAVVLAGALDAALSASGTGWGNGPLHTKDLVRSALGRVLGCSHAIVDPSLPLGRQSLGRAIFAGHSFYNHSCVPNAYLSSFSSSSVPAPEAAIRRVGRRGLCARVHLLRSVRKGEEITLSYLPLSGLSTQERRERLRQSYGFWCRCRACLRPAEARESSKNEKGNDGKLREKNTGDRLTLPQSYDYDGVGASPIDAIREIQFGLNDRLLELGRGITRSATAAGTTTTAAAVVSPEAKEHEESLQEILGVIAMTERGIQNQNLPESHEVSIESDRLAAAALDAVLMLRQRNKRQCGGTTDSTTTQQPRLGDGKTEGEDNTKNEEGDPCPDSSLTTELSAESRDRHLRFFRKVSAIRQLFDPVALGTQHLENASSILLRRGEHGRDRRLHGDDAGVERDRGLRLLATSLGRDHPWVRSLLAENAAGGGVPRCSDRSRTASGESETNEPAAAKRQRMGRPTARDNPQ